ncbi:hypothetical protein N8E87_10445 [Avibacterium paragallinarum]|uniref:hypothetical protein n=1 Tax=Avibacterium paragallinarum TaxID=728 RepID=UPI0021F7D1D5|nr:hypothetical protein [Avibacterium paragallinarum]UXN36571.1 hypothetical protein N8E87_10445 [Avibacterium paragallinarum]
MKYDDKSNFKMRAEIEELYDYLDQCDDELKINEKQFINLKILKIVERYLKHTKNEDIINIYNKSKYYWKTLDNQINLDELKESAWELNNKLFGITYNNIDAIILRFLLGTIDNNSNKDYFDQSFDFDDYLLDLAEQLGY